MVADDMVRQMHKLRALMARTVANGCTEDEELAAARMVGRLIDEVDARNGPTPDVNWADAERRSPGYQAALEKGMLATLFKAAIQELALNHINTVSPPRRKLAGGPVQRVDVREMLVPHLAMMLSAAGSTMARQMIADALEELIQDGLLPEGLSIPIGG
ncbi:MAG: hypothetical protein HY985_17245 [Magnetospirillum sp.]|nr:hypothetical protein [Magnetospirillum sp.]